MKEINTLKFHSLFHYALSMGYRATHKIKRSRRYLQPWVAVINEIKNRRTFGSRMLIVEANHAIWWHDRLSKITIKSNRYKYFVLIKLQFPEICLQRFRSTCTGYPPRLQQVHWLYTVRGKTRWRGRWLATRSHEPRWRDWSREHFIPMAALGS